MLNFSAALIKATLAIYMALKEVPLEVCVRMFLQINHEIVRVFRYLLVAVICFQDLPKCE